MLDFYKIPDTEPADDYPIESEHIHSFTLEEFRELSELTEFAKTQSLTFHFFSDFRLMHNDIKKLLAFIEQNKSKFLTPSISEAKKTAYNKIETLFLRCANSGTGVVAFCD